MSGYNSIVTAQAANANYTSAPVSKQQSTGYSVQVVFAGDTISGTLAIESSTNNILQGNPLSASNTATGYGSGGAGAQAGGTTNTYAGGAGSIGLAVITWYTNQ